MLAVVYVSFTDSSPLVVHEVNESATVCVLLTGVRNETKRAIVVSVTSQDGTALSKFILRFVCD